MSKPTILCAAYGGGHVNAARPVARALHKRGWDVHFLALTTAFQSVANEDFHVWRVCDLVGSQEDEILAFGYNLVGEDMKAGAVDYQESVAYHGLGYFDLVARYGEKKSAERFAASGRAAFEHRELAKRLIDRVRPDVVFTTNSPRAEKALIDVAQERAIPGIVLNDTLASMSNYWLHESDYADRILVMNERVREELLRSGHAPEKIVVTGNPAFAAMVDLRARRGRSNRRGRSLKVLYASQSLPEKDKENQRRTLEELHRIAARRTDISVVCRPHPNESIAAIGVSEPVIVSQGRDLIDDLADTDVLVTHGSTVGIEAALAGIPVVLQKGTDIAEKCRFDDYGIATANHDISGLEQAIDRAAAQEVNTFSSMPNNSLENVIAVIEETTNRH